MVHLHGQLAARLDVQQLHLEARADVERLEMPPGPVVPEVLLLLLAAALAQALDDLGDVLRALAVGHQQRVGRVDDDEIAARRWSPPAPSRCGCSCRACPRARRRRWRSCPSRRAAPAPTATTRSRRRSSRRRSAAPPPCRCAPSRHSRSRCRAPRAKALRIEPQEAQVLAWPRRAPPWPLPGWPAAGAPSSSRNACAPSTKMPLFQE